MKLDSIIETSEISLRDEMYKDETGSEKGSSKRKIVEAETFSIDERITIISGIIVIVGTNEGEST